MSERTYEYLPIKDEHEGAVRIGFRRTHVLDLTEKDKQYLDALEALKAKMQLTKARQDPEVAKLINSYLSDDPSDWFAVEGKQIHEA